jgi:hypothetical protein
MSFGQNPFDPQGGFSNPSGFDQDAAAKVGGPAVGLIVVGALNILSALYNIVTGIMGAAGAGAQPVPADPEAAEAIRMIQAITGPTAVIFGLIGLVAAAVIILGAVKMKNLQSYGLAMTSSILAMIPCVSCCIVGLPIGIWSLVVLSKPEVKSAFH